MAKRPDITTIASGYYSRQALNNNFESLRDKFDNTLSLDGSTPNAMGADLDLNGNNIIGATGLLINGTDYLVDIEAAKAAALTAQAGAETAETNAETAESNAEASETAAATSATNAASSASAASSSASAAASSASAASTSETNAETAETGAQASATAAATSETNAAASETNAATSAANAATSESNAASSASSAQASKDAALAALDSFDDRYLGQKASDPTVDNDGDALVAGALYFNTTDEIMKVYDGSLWVAAYASLSGAMFGANNLSDVASSSASRLNLGLTTVAATGDYTDLTNKPTLGTAATTDSTDYATAAQGSLADSALQDGDTVASLTLTSADINGGSIDGTAINTSTIDGTVIGGSTPAAGTFTALTSTGIDDNATSTAITIDSSQNVGIGTSSPSRPLHVAASDGLLARLQRTGAFTGSWDVRVGTLTTGDFTIYDNENSKRAIQIDKLSGGGSDPALKIDSSGNLLVGTTTNSGASSPQNSSSPADVGLALEPSGGLQIGRYENSPLRLNRMSTDGDIAVFRKDGSTVGSIGTRAGEMALGTGNTGLRFYNSQNSLLPCDPSSGFVGRDNAIDLGYSTNRFDDVYATNGTIQTSDRNEKQDIEALSDAEQRVAVACKGLLRKFRWKDAVAEKGDDARIHFGIIAQDLQDAFAAEGLDAGRYAMFISSTWWETQTEVPAVEAVEAVDATYDEDGNELTPAVEAVEAKDAYTRTDTYETLEEAPEGATERTRLGVRYPELLAFIIGAM